MKYRIKHSKKVINRHKFERISKNHQTMVCNVYYTKDGELFSGTGLYLGGWVYIALPTGYYSYTVRDIGTHKDNMAFQPLYLANPF